jgi:hypothetical protein
MRCVARRSCRGGSAKPACCGKSNGKRPVRRFQLTEQGLGRAARLATRRQSDHIGDLRQRASEQQDEGLRRARRILTKALQGFERVLDSSEVDELLKDLLAQRREAAA